MGAIEKLFIDF